MAPLKTPVGITRWKPMLNRQNKKIKTYKPPPNPGKAGMNVFRSQKSVILKKINMKKKIKVVKKNVPRMKLRASLKPGKICIIVEGRHKGKRVVFLKQLHSGLCVITGPFGLNHCPMRRIHQAFLIATSVQLDFQKQFKSFNMNPITDKYFRRLGETKKKSIDGVRSMNVRYYKVSKKRKIVQRKVDNEVLKAIAKHKDKNHVWRYLCTKFALKNKDYPHCMKF